MGPMVRRTNGRKIKLMVGRTNGLTNHWSVVQWSVGKLVKWSVGPMVYQPSVGPMVRSINGRKVELMVRRTIGLMHGP